MNLLAVLLRFYSYLYHALLCLFVFGLTVLANVSRTTDLKLGMIPYTGADLIHVLMYSALIGLVSLVLAVTGIFRYMFPVWAFLVAVQAVRWLILSPYAFPGPSDFKGAIWLTIGALGAFLAALQLFKTKERLRRERGQKAGAAPVMRTTHSAA